MGWGEWGACVRGCVRGEGGILLTDFVPTCIRMALPGLADRLYILHLGTHATGRSRIISVSRCIHHNPTPPLWAHVPMPARPAPPGAARQHPLPAARLASTCITWRQRGRRSASYRLSASLFRPYRCTDAPSTAASSSACRQAKGQGAAGGRGPAQAGRRVGRRQQGAPTQQIGTATTTMRSTRPVSNTQQQLYACHCIAQQNPPPTCQHTCIKKRQRH